MKTKKLKEEMLTGNQAQTVKYFIQDSMRDVYTSLGTLPGYSFEHASEIIADKILKNIQTSLIQNSVFEKIVKNSKPAKKHVRK